MTYVCVRAHICARGGGRLQGLDMLYTPPTPDLAPQRKKVEVTGEMGVGKRGGQGRWASGSLC